MNIFAGNSLWYIICQSDAMSKFVLLILLIMSVICWTLFIGKLSLLYLKKRQFNAIHKKIQKAQAINDLIDCAASSINTLPGYFITKNITFLKELLRGNPQQTITPHEWEMVERYMDTTINELLLHNEKNLSVLSSCAAVAPLLGLFGTVWGLIHSFMRISETQSADIAIVAPGIAEALITTLAGLIVAIPALVMFNYLQTKVHFLEHCLITLADKIILIFQRQRERS